MARTVAGLAPGTRLADYITLGVVTTTFPLATIRSLLAETGRASQRERDLPAHVMVYYVIALALYSDVSTREVLRCLLEGVRWLAGPDARLTPAGRSGISQARTRLGEAPLRRLYETVVRPVATAATPGAYYRQWRTVSLDGTTLDVADTVANADAFGRPTASRGTSAFPQVRLVTLAETGTHVLFGGRLAPYATSEVTLAHEVMASLTPGMLCLADRFFPSFDLWQQAAATGAALLWRIRKNARLPVHERLADGSYLSVLQANWHCRAADQQPQRVRVIEYALPGVPDADPIYRLVTTLLDPAAAPATELAALYHERWEIEGAFDELKTHLKGAPVVLRSKTPELVRQEVYGLLLAHYAIRGLMHEAALSAPPTARDPDTLSFVHAIRVIRRTLPQMAALPPSGSATPTRDDPGRVARRDGEPKPGARRATRRQTEDDPLPPPASGAPTDSPPRLHSPRP
jgi:hypothetical protein